ncbi:MAG: hypothetical protein AB7O24_03700 [Kofleriaceae bacterium]
MSNLDALIQRAREATVRHDIAEGYVRSLDQWAQRAQTSAPRRWLPWLVTAVAIAAAIVALAIRRPQATVVATAVRLGDRVAIVADADTVYRVARAERETTTITVERGRITARLWPGRQPHKLSLEGGGVVATATGTVYSLAVTSNVASVDVDHGTVLVEDAHGAHSVHAGEVWPATSKPRDRRAAEALLALSELLPATPADGLRPASPVDAGIIVDGAADAHEPARDASAPPLDAAEQAPLTIKDRWRRARLLRSQAKFKQALADCVAIADANDPVWSPIALVEATRIYAGPLASPEQAIRSADRLLRDWPTAELASEARKLRCQAHAALGRTPTECKSVPR